MGQVEDMSSENCSNEVILKELREVKKLLAQVLGNSSGKSNTKNREYKRSDAKKEKALQIGRRMLIMSPGIDGIPTVRELANGMGVSTASLYNKGDNNPYSSIIEHRKMLIESYSSHSTSASLREGVSTFSEDASGKKSHCVDGVHYDEEIDDF